MAEWLTVAKITDFVPDTFRVVAVKNISILLFNINDNYYAIENVCSHDGGTLSEGHLEGDEIVCPRHGAHFCVKTGAVTQPPAYEDVRAFEVRVIGQDIQVQTF